MPSSISEGSKVRENRARRMARRQGYVLAKSRRRDPLATDYGVYVLAGTDDEAAELLTAGHGVPLSQIETQLSEPRDRGLYRATA